MAGNFSYLNYPEGGFSLKPVAVHLYVPPIAWKGDPLGHIGENDCIFFVVSGECCICIEEESFVLQAGQMAFLPRGKKRTYTTMDENITMYEVAFEFRINDHYWYDELNFKRNHCCVDVQDPAALAVFFEGSIRHEVNKNIVYDVICFSNVAEILRAYITACYAAEIRAQPFAEVLTFMRDEMHRTIRVEEPARIACMQTTYFIKKFKSAFGLSPISYLNKLRIYRAMTLLLATDMSVERIADTVGIFDNSYFSRMFKKFCSVSPMEYRNQFRRTE